MNLDKLGQDEWVAQVAKRRREQNPTVALVLERWQKLPRWGQLALLLAVPVLLPVLVHNDYILRVVGLVWLYAVLALGLNVVVGLTGLLDLGYVAFFGVGGYAYALLSSGQFNIHLPTVISLPLVTLLTVGLGFALGLPSLRLTGDYLAIVTLGFGQIFVQLTTAMNRVYVPWSANPIDLTGGPNGIVALDPIHFLSVRAGTVTDYYYLLLLTLIVVMVGLISLNRSRIGRAWRSIREDALAAEAMGIPTNRMRLLAFAVGAGIAGFAGCLFAAWQQSVFPANFDVPLLITLYAMVVLGGVGSLWGMIAGAFVITVIPELLRPGNEFAGIELQQIVFYGGALAMLTRLLRPRRRLLTVLGALVVGGLMIHVIAVALIPAQILIDPPNVIQRWLVIPADSVTATALGNFAFFIVTGLFVLWTQIRARWRDPVLIVALYILAFVWETRLSQEPSTTVLLLTGVALIMLMNYRPQGLLGQRRVEIA
ncbi:MAG: branched-chain amino acid ABC transporter permease [Aggregatilineales bacterium]